MLLRSMLFVVILWTLDSVSAVDGARMVEPNDSTDILERIRNLQNEQNDGDSQLESKLSDKLSDIGERSAKQDFTLFLKSLVSSAASKASDFISQGPTLSEQAIARTASETNLSRDDVLSLMISCKRLPKVIGKWIVKTVLKGSKGKLKELTKAKRGDTETRSFTEFVRNVWAMLKTFVQEGEATSLVKGFVKDIRRTIEQCAKDDRHFSEAGKLDSGFVDRQTAQTPRAHEHGKDNETSHQAKTKKHKKRKRSKSSKKELKRSRTPDEGASSTSLVEKTSALERIKFETRSAFGHAFDFIFDTIFEEYMPDIAPRFLRKRLVPQKWKMFQACLMVDLIGIAANLGFLPPPFSQLLGLIWFVVQMLWINAMFDGSKKIIAFQVANELLLPIDLFPVSTACWFFSYTNGPGHSPIRKLMSLPDRTVAGRQSCPMSVLLRIKRDYKIVKDNQKGHIYLKCRSFFAMHKAKASCLEEDCGGLGGFCFVPKHCGKEKNRCEELEDQNPLRCSSSTEQGAIERIHERKRQNGDAEMHAKLRREAAKAKARPRKKRLDDRRGKYKRADLVRDRYERWQ
eukprot:TRINITY_DN24399_c0_g1_i1.p1 TRINITY_DN24399_c0_g1~~TRINITY_DN24399_c0_g1_i1.p1  ORF type:complete len:572 (-),score=46.80 TRINITY_DN24399_c0_g1_i1:112-1827(-)